MKILTKRLLLLVLLLSPISLLDAQTLAERLDQLLKEYNSNEIFNGSILIADSSGIILEKGYGYANYKENIKNTAQTQFRIGSLTKQFTATVIMQLIEEGKMNLKDPITKYIPEYRKDTGDSITVHMLLNHSSGIHSYTNVPGWVQDSAGFRFEKDHMLMYTMADDLEFKPGTAFNYNNTGYYLLAIIAERASGVPYELLLSKRIFTPAGMNSTTVEREDNNPPLLAQGYTRKGAHFVEDKFFYMANAMGAGDVVSTVGDMYKWDQALYGDDFLTNNSKERMWTPYFEGYGYGWGILNANGPGAEDSSTFITHSGSITGFESFFARFVDEDITIILLSNNGPTALSKIAWNMRAILRGEEPRKINRPFVPELEKILTEKGYEESVTYFKENKDSILYNFTLDEVAINLAGYNALVEELNTPKAIAIFKINIEAFPESFNVYDSMGEAYMKKGDNQKAIEFYNKSLSINPGNSNAIEMLKKLGEDIDTPQEIKLKNEDLVKYEGRYQLAPNFFIEITVSEDRIFEQASGQAKYEIFPITEIDFILKIVDAKIKFLVSETGIVKGLTLFQNNQSMVGEKVD